MRMIERKERERERESDERERGKEGENPVKVGVLFRFVKNRKTNRGRASTLVTERRFIKN